ncbi:MAG: hypothetical protein RLZZ182_1748, partial [Pseudomonadota bacterium]
MTIASSDRVPAEFQNLLLSLSALDLTDVGLGDATRATALQALRNTTRSAQLALLHLRAPEQHAMSALELWCCPASPEWPDAPPGPERQPATVGHDSPLPR